MIKQESSNGISGRKCLQFQILEYPMPWHLFKERINIVLPLDAFSSLSFEKKSPNQNLYRLRATNGNDRPSSVLCSWERRSDSYLHWVEIFNLNEVNKRVSLNFKYPPCSSGFDNTRPLKNMNSLRLIKFAWIWNRHIYMIRKALHLIGAHSLYWIG